MKRKPITLTFTGRLPFPVDMLRYDSCHPTDIRDVNEILASIQRENTAPYVVTVTSLAGRLTIERWRSFGWDLHTGNRKS